MKVLTGYLKLLFQLSMYVHRYTLYMVHIYQVYISFTAPTFNNLFCSIIPYSMAVIRITQYSRLFSNNGHYSLLYAAIYYSITLPNLVHCTAHKPH